MAAQRVRGRAPGWEPQAAVLASASAHWLRATTLGTADDERLLAQRRGCAA
ncbi:hypothetical protein D9M72_218190 [compost metagenome]